MAHKTKPKVVNLGKDRYGMEQWDSKRVREGNEKHHIVGMHEIVRGARVHKNVLFQEYSVVWKTIICSEQLFLYYLKTN